MYGFVLAGNRSIAETSKSPHLFPIAHEHGSNADGVVRGEGVAAANVSGGGEGDDELQDGGHSKRRRLAGGDDSGRPLLPPPIAPGAQAPTVAREHAEGDGQDDCDEEVGRVPRVRPDLEKPTARKRQEHNISITLSLMVQTLPERSRSITTSSEKVR